MDNSGFKSIGSLSRSLGQDGFGTRYVYPRDGALPGDSVDAETVPVDLAANARSLGAHVIECTTYDDVVAALKSARAVERTTLIYVRNDRMHAVPGYDSWWDVPVAEVSDSESVRAARREWEQQRARERYFG
jgi:3D-(3,5/4)-trihydroxycyclohexane-1,2-dione acylhydrolase (decyclizing)